MVVNNHKKIATGIVAVEIVTTTTTSTENNNEWNLVLKMQTALNEK